MARNIFKRDQHSLLAWQHWLLHLLQNCLWNGCWAPRHPVLCSQGSPAGASPWEVSCVTPTKRTQLASTAFMALSEVGDPFFGYGFCFVNYVDTRTNMSKLSFSMCYPEIPLLIPLPFYLLWVKAIPISQLPKVYVSLNYLLLCLMLSLCTESM